MRRSFFYFLLVFSFISVVSCGGNSGVAESTAQPEHIADPATESAGENYSGVYMYDRGKNGGAELLVQHIQDENLIKISLEILAGPPAHNQGYMGTSAPIKGNVAIVTMQDYGDCRFSITFIDESAIIATLDEARDCGFGNGVVADGNFVKTSGDVPILPGK